MSHATFKLGQCGIGARELPFPEHTRKPSGSSPNITHRAKV